MLNKITTRYNNGQITTYDPHDFYNPNTRTINALIKSGNLEVYNPNEGLDFAAMVANQNPAPLQTLVGWFYGTNAVRPTS